VDLESVGVVVLGLVLGPLGLLAYNWMAQRLVRSNPDPALRTNRGQAQFILAATAALVAMSAVMFFGIWVFGFYPLYSRGPLFFWSFFIGAAVFSTGVRLMHHIRGLPHARDGDS
jgi:hypothetical protein